MSRFISPLWLNYFCCSARPFQSISVIVINWQQMGFAINGIRLQLEHQAVQHKCIRGRVPQQYHQLVWVFLNLRYVMEDAERSSDCWTSKVFCQSKIVLVKTGGGAWTSWDNKSPTTVTQLHSWLTPFPSISEQSSDVINTCLAIKSYAHWWPRGHLSSLSGCERGWHSARVTDHNSTSRKAHEPEGKPKTALTG